jgi:hypothetical protein
MGNFRAATGELGAAEAEVRRMLQISPSWGEGYFDLGGVLLLEGKVQAYSRDAARTDGLEPLRGSGDGVSRDGTAW